MTTIDCINCLACAENNGECIFKEHRCDCCNGLTSKLYSAYYTTEEDIVINVCDECISTKPYIIGLS